MKKLKTLAIVLAALIVMMTVAAIAGIPAQAADAAEAATAAEAVADNTVGTKAVAAAIAIGLAALAGAFSMGIAIAKSNEGVARQPEAAGKIQTMMMLGLVFIETVVIYALIVAILIIFVL